VLLDTELAKILATAAHRDVYGAILTALAYTGQRLGQFKSFRQEWIEGDTIRFPAAIMKSGKEHIIPCGPTILPLLQSLRPFTDWGKAKRRFDLACPLPHWTTHDLRRTFATGLANLDVPPHIIERLLAHTGGQISGVAATYNRARYMQPMREAVEKWEAHLETLTHAS
jgi:integrase